MNRTRSRRPEDLSDGAIIERLREIALAAVQSFTDDETRFEWLALKRELQGRRYELWWMARGPAAAQNINGVIDGLKPLSVEARLREVNQSFDAWLGHVVLAEPESVPTAKPIGRPTPSQQAAIVKQLAPNALRIVDELVMLADTRRHNGGPLEAGEAEALDRLKELKCALEELIDCIERERPLGRALSRLENLRQRALDSTLATLASDAAVIQASATTLTYGAMIAVVVGWLTGTGFDSVSSIAAAGSFVTAHTAYRAVHSTTTPKD